MRERKRLRHPYHNYSAYAWYHVTICTKFRIPWFGKIKNDEMVLNELGGVVETQWEWLSTQYTYVNIDEYIIMPDHFHGIINIDPHCVERKIKPLPQIIGAFKTTSSKQIHQLDHHEFAWQRSYWDEIIKSEKQYQNVRKYIQGNLHSGRGRSRPASSL